ncbi:MAG: tRNA(5-methylaminomethyl-2-thiouridylate) methyltransferase [Bilophila wadsworthia]
MDVGEAFVRLLRTPPHGFGKVMNPCVDCKILVMRKARELMKNEGVIHISIEVRRPVSQRRDTLNVIRRDAEVKESLLRPLSAQLLDPTAPEISGLVDRNKLLGIFGRGRKSQMALADQMGLKEIPTPAGGCKLAEKENSRRYWPVLTRLKEPTVEDFELSNIGRQYWFGDHWLSMGRNEADNSALERLVRPGDAILRVRLSEPFRTCPPAHPVGQTFRTRGLVTSAAQGVGCKASPRQDHSRAFVNSEAPCQCSAQTPRPSVGRAGRRYPPKPWRRTDPRLMSNDGRGGGRPSGEGASSPTPLHLTQNPSRPLSVLRVFFVSGLRERGRRGRG